jgi:hypothetical protein
MKNIKLSYEGQLDPRLENYYVKLNERMSDNSMVNEGAQKGGIVSEETLVLLEELDKLTRVVKNLKRDVRKVIQEELDTLMNESTLITEGAADQLTITIGKHTFKGKVKMTK